MTPQEIEQLTPSQQIIIIAQLSSVQIEQLTTEQAVAFGIINSQGQEQAPRHSQQESRWQNAVTIDNSTVASANLTATTNSTNITTSQISTAAASAAPEQATEYGKKFKRDGSIRMTGLMKERSNLDRVVKA